MRTPGIARVSIALAAAAAAAWGVACTRAAPPPNDAPSDLVGVRLIDSTRVESESLAVYLHRVEVRLDRVDTIPGLLTTDLPALVGDTAVLGLAVGGDGWPTNLFRYRVASRRYETLPLPEDLATGVSGVAVAPSGRWMAYVVFDTSGWAQGVIRRFPNGPVLRRSPIVFVEPAPGRLAEAEWTDSTTAALYVDGFGDRSGRWFRLRGDAVGGKWRVDTVTMGP